MFPMETKLLAKKEDPKVFNFLEIQQFSIFPGRRQPSIFDDWKLNFCVRDENRWILPSIATGYGIITDYYLKLSLIGFLKP